MPTILISGAANGLGLAFVEHYCKDSVNKVIAIDRQTTDQLTNTGATVYANVDVSSETLITELANKLQSQAIDLVIHSAGIRGLVPEVENQHPDNVAACETLEVMNAQTMTKAFQINAAGTFSLIRALLPNLRSAKDPKVIVMSSRMGSLSNNQLPNAAAGGAYAYRASKAAMNAIVRSFAIDVPDITFVLCHPGRVETKLVRCREEGAITVEESVNAIVPLIEKWNKKESGKFFDRHGDVIPW